MNELEGITQNNNIMIVKQGLEMMLSKLESQTKVNNPLIKQIKADCERLNSVYMYLNGLKLESKDYKRKNIELIHILETNQTYTLKFEKKVRRLEQELKEIKLNIKEI